MATEAISALKCNKIATDYKGQRDGVLQMKGNRVVWPQRGVADLEEFEVHAPAEREIIVRSRVTLISPGTERAFFLGLPNATAQFPYYPGYCCVGDVVHQEDESAIQKGTRVVCQTPHASHCTVALQECVSVPDGVADEDAVFFALIAIALQGIRKARIELGESVAVIGAGVIGLLAAQLAKLSGALPVVLIEKDPHRLEFALQLGADAALLADDDLPTAIEGICEEGASVVIEATGHPQAILQAFSLARRGGRVVLLGSTRGLTEQVDFYRAVHQKGLHIIGAHNSTRPQHDRASGWWPLRDDQSVALQLLKAGRLDVHSLLTHALSWKDAPKAYKLLADSQGNTLGILLDWRD